MATDIRELRFQSTEEKDEVSALLMRPEDAGVGRGSGRYSVVGGQSPRHPNSISCSSARRLGALDRYDCSFRMMDLGLD